MADEEQILLYASLHSPEADVRLCVNSQDGEPAAICVHILWNKNTEAYYFV